MADHSLSTIHYSPSRYSGLPLAWYMAAGYGLPAGIEAHILHYATEMRNHGFDTRVVVFKELPGGNGGVNSELKIVNSAGEAENDCFAGAESAHNANYSPLTIHHSLPPAARHRFLAALEQRGIPIMSLYDAVGRRAGLLARLLYVPWRAHRWAKAVISRKDAKTAKEKESSPRITRNCAKGEGITTETRSKAEGGGRGRDAGPESDGDGGNRKPGSGANVRQACDSAVSSDSRRSSGLALPPPVVVSSAAPWHAEVPERRRQREIPLSVNSVSSVVNLQLWMTRRLGLRLLGRMLAKEKPAVIHVFGRLPMGAWGALPPERTIFHEMMTGTVDACWNEEELAEFRGFAATCARVFAPGSGVAANMRREFGITRPIDVIFTMCPDER